MYIIVVVAGHLITERCLIYACVLITDHKIIFHPNAWQIMPDYPVRIVHLQSLYGQRCLSSSDILALFPASMQHHDTPLRRLSSPIRVHLPKRVFPALWVWLDVGSAIIARQEETRSSLDDLPCSLMSLFSRILLEPLVPCIVFGLLGPGPL